MYVVIDVITPTKLSREQKKLFEELNKTNLETDSIFSKFRSYL